MTTTTLPPAAAEAHIALIDVPATTQARLVIIGGGFGGIELAKKLRKAPLQIVLLDRNNYHTFQPLLYQVATAGLEADSIAYPLRKIFRRQRNFFFRLANVEQILPQQNQVLTNIGSISYDYLVIATGSTTNFFGMQQVARHAMPMKSVAEALNLRSLILQNLEAALQAAHPTERAACLNFVVVGGGPTGVETAGALAELKKHVLPNDYPELDMSQMQIYLLEASDRLLNGMAAVSGQKAADFLQNFGVHLLLNTAVTNYDGQQVTLKDAPAIPSHTLVWSAGVMGNIPSGIDAQHIMRGNRLLVDAYCQLQNHTNIWAIGDVAAELSDPRYPRAHPMVAPVAMQQGHLVAQNLQNLMRQQHQKTFKYFDKGSMATVGRNRAVVEVGKFTMQGLIAWFMWMAVHLMTLVGFRNKLVTLINWLWSYLNYDRGIRLIIRPYQAPTPPTNE